ncbi:glycosyltransferase family 39 protein [Spirillospora sp. NPDC047418]
MTATPHETERHGRPDGEEPGPPPASAGATARAEVTDGAGTPRRRPAAPWTLPLLPAALTLAITLIGIGNPSLWLDEAATISMTTRSYGEMLRVFDHLDLVHALYYMVMKPWVAVFGTSAVALRLPSALAMAAAAAGITVIGRRCLGTPAGVLGGLAWAVGLQTSRWAQEARSYAMTAAVAVLATYLLVRAVDRDERRPWRWFAGYTAAIALLGFLHLHGALLLAAHGTTLLLMRPKAGVWVRWTVSAALAAAPLVPFALAARNQKLQVEWLPKPTWDVAWSQLQFFSGGRAIVWVVVTLSVIGVIAAVRVQRGRSIPLLSPGTVPLPAVALPWLVLPTVLLVAVSLVSDPVFFFRYTTYCLPAAALLVGAGLARVLAAAGRRADQAAVMAVAAVALVTPSIQDHLFIREQGSRPEDMERAADVIRGHARPGDAIVYLSGVVRWSAAAYPDVFGRLRDVDQRIDPVSAANLKGRDMYPRDLPPKLARVDRVWVMSHQHLDLGNPVIQRRERAVQAGGPWRQAGRWTYTGGWLVLYVRTGPYRTSR